MDEVVVTADEVRAFRARLVETSCSDANPAELVELLDELEVVKNVASGLQARAAVALDRARREEEAELDVPAGRRGSGVAGEIALARRESGSRGRQLLSLATFLDRELPHTRARLAEGTLSEYRASLLAKEMACLDRSDRMTVDEQLCGAPARLNGMGTRALVAAAKKAAAEIDVKAVVTRARQAESDRRVTLRPAPDTMCYLTALVPVAQGVGALAALGKEADRLRQGEGGDPRGRGQLMADVMIARLTGAELPAADQARPASEAPGADTSGTGDGARAAGQTDGLELPPPSVPITVNVTMSDVALLGGGSEPAVVTAPGAPSQVLPAEVARQLVSRALTAPTKTWIRRLYLDPGGALVAMTSKGRYFPPGLADYLAIRDQGICRMPYCGAPVRHLDHVTPAAEGGDTDAEDGQGLCEACNHSKQAPGWRQHIESRAGPPDGGGSGRACREGHGVDAVDGASEARESEWVGISEVVDDSEVVDAGVSGTAGSSTEVPRCRHTVVTTTPSAHTYRSVAPTPPGAGRPLAHRRTRRQNRPHDSGHRSSRDLG
ncbi:HNH endonuclease [Georgenia deserti]|uniref:HNH endonuclease n=1 Tax=Georgenia deserti TaxID=2093781 RepID=A0ABW4L7M6_9MICO